MGGIPKAKELTGISSLAGLFLFKTVPFGDVAEAETATTPESEAGIGGLGRRRRNGDEEGEEGEGEEEEAGEEQDDAVEEAAAAEIEVMIEGLE